MTTTVANTCDLNSRQVPLICSGHTRPVVHLCFSGVTDTGYYLISACKDGKPMLRQGDTGDWIGTFEGHKGAVWGVALNREATKAASGAADFCAKIWDAITGEELLSLPHSHIVKSVNFSYNNDQLITASADKLIQIFDLEKPKEDPEYFKGHTQSVRCACLFADDKRIVSCSDDKTIKLWDRASGKETHSAVFPSCPISLEVSADGTVVTVAYGSTISFWDSRDLNKIQELTIPTKVYSASLHPSKSIVVCGGEDLKVYKYDFTSGVEIDSFKGHFGPVHCCRFSPDGELYASGSEDGTIRLWQTTVGKSYGLWRNIDDVLLGNYDEEDEQLLAELIADVDELDINS